MTGPRDLSRHRPNVGLVLFNQAGLVFLGRRAGHTRGYCWQLPQGGIDEGEDVAAAARRELFEETGVRPALAQPLAEVGEWLAYDFPEDVLAAGLAAGKPWLGQKQRWFAFRFLGEDADIDLDAHPPREFDAWRWERLERAAGLVIPWKRPVYEAVARAFAPYAAS